MNGDATEVAPLAMEDFYWLAFNTLDNPANNHANLLVTDNCKTETTKLGQLARDLAK
jgi:hypothetical protein